MHQPNDDKKQAIIQKIAALLQKTEGNGCSPEEAASAAAMANKLLLQYNLAMSSVEDNLNKKHKKQFYKGFFDLRSRQSKTEANWIAALVNTLCKFNICSCFQRRDRSIENDQGGMVIVGDSVNIEIVCYLTEQLIPQIQKGCSAAWKRYGESSGEKRNTFRRGYLLGCVSGIYAKLDQERIVREMEAKYNSQGESSQILALVKREDIALQSHMKEAYNTDNMQKGRSGETRKSDLSKKIGFEDGRNMSMKKGIEDTKNSGFIN